jgi:RNA polymerase sigma factor (sigma-70 family)
MKERPVPPQQGDEHELFERYSERLRRATKLAIRTTPDIVDDACAFAWMKLVSNQPERATVFGWLRMVARNEALRLDRLSRSVSGRVSHDFSNAGEFIVPASRGKAEVAQGLMELHERLEQLPQRQREIVFLNAAGWRYADIAQDLGISEARVGQLLARASQQMREMDMRALEVTSPRGRRLREIEDDPPLYIVASIGRQPRAHRKTGGEEVKREWKRLVLEIEDYRKANGITDKVLPLGRDVREPDVTESAAGSRATGATAG